MATLFQRGPCYVGHVTPCPMSATTTPCRRRGEEPNPGAHQKKASSSSATSAAIARPSCSGPRQPGRNRHGSAAGNIVCPLHRWTYGGGGLACQARRADRRAALPERDPASTCSATRCANGTACCSGTAAATSPPTSPAWARPALSFEGMVLDHVELHKLQLEDLHRGLPWRTTTSCPSRPRPGHLRRPRMGVQSGTRCRRSACKPAQGAPAAGLPEMAPTADGLSAGQSCPSRARSG